MTESKLLADAGVSAREGEVLALLGEHRTNAEIASRLFISVRTVESHVSSLLRKLGMSDRRGLADYAAALNADRPSSPAEQRVTRALPSPLTSFVGRTAERAELTRALTVHRLVSAVGPGGVGKTRLLLAVTADLADRYPDGAWYVDLVPVTDPDMVASKVAAALGLAEESARTVTETVIATLSDHRALLVLDNCEHLVESVGVLVERLLAGCPELVVLVASRTRLLVPFESVYAVPPLSLPDGEDDGGDAVALFVERAAAAGAPPFDYPDLRRIGEVCRRLDGIALAVELAAARVLTLGLDGLESGLTDRLRLLTGGPRVDERHRSLRAALDWSWELLGPLDQAVLRRVSVFSAPFTADAAAEVAGFPPVDSADLPGALARLADHSLLVAESGPGGTCYRALETIRQYGAGRLDDAGDEVDLRTNHLRWSIASGDRLHQRSDASSGPWRVAFDAVGDDLRAALGWAAEQPGLRADAHRLAGSLAGLTFVRGMPSEAQRRYEQAAELADGDAVAAEHLRLAAATAKCRFAGDDASRLYRAAAEFARRAGDHVRAAQHLTSVVELYARFPGLMNELPTVEDVEALLAEATALAGSEPRIAAMSLMMLLRSDQIREPLAAELIERAVELARRADVPVVESAALDQLSVVETVRGDLRAAVLASRERVELLDPLQLDPEAGFELSDALHMAAMTSIGAGDLPAALRYAEQRQRLPIYREEAHLMLNWVLIWAALSGHLDRAVEMSETFRAGWERAGRPALGGLAYAPAAMAMVHGLRGDDEARGQWLDIHEQFRRTIADLVPETGYLPAFDAILLLHLGRAGDAMTATTAEPESVHGWVTGVWRQWYAALWAEAAVLAGDSAAPDRVDRARFITADNPVAGAMVERSDALLTGDRPALLEAAARLDAAECPYQRARTLVLAGGAERAEGLAALAAMGTVPMAG